VSARPRGRAARRVVAMAAVFGASILATPAAAASGAVLASYSFEDDVATGPDTFAIWQGTKGRVALTTDFHVSGFRAVELRDVAGDGNFPELQGYFPVRNSGRLFFHFAMLTTDAREELNIALAGPRYFTVEKDGIGFWLSAQDGTLVHHSDSIPRKLLPLEAFVWYSVDVTFDVGAGRYDLVIGREGRREPVVALRDQPNAANQPRSAVDKFSFVGAPFSDRSNVTYYVDDVMIATDEAAVPAAFVAPGRRKLFVDSFQAYERLLREKARCLPAGGPADLGLSAADMSDLQREGALYALETLLRGGTPDWNAFPAERRRRFGPRLQALADWNDGCALLERGDPTAALARFERAEAAAPAGHVFTLSAALALAGLGRFDHADLRLARLAAVWQDDPRYAVASAYVGVRRGDLDRAEEWLRAPAEGVLDRDLSPALRLLRSGLITLDLVEALKREAGELFRERVEETFVAEQYYYVLLWKARYDLARGYADRMVTRLSRAGVATSLWYERSGDAAFFAGDVPVARELYAEAEKGEPARASLLLKQADVAFLLGDVETERRLRERFYGAFAAE
jgi:tetratricopeptide (TPR) repeat protein